MELRDYIEEGATKAGSLTALGRMLDISQPDMSNAKAMRKPLPVKAIVQLAEYIGADLKAVIAANELATEKDERKRAFWFPYAQHAKAASIALAYGMTVNLAAPSPSEAAQTTTTPAFGGQYSIQLSYGRLGGRILPFAGERVQSIAAATQSK